jgi:hypothetical protein
MNLDAIIEITERPQLPSPDEARRLLRSRGVISRELADAIGVHPVTVRKWLAGSQRPTGKRGEAYAYAIQLIAAREEMAD